ncbi:MAG: hypothetical protein ACT4QA_01170 [Panacagrimonas sp.]
MIQVETLSDEGNRDYLHPCYKERSKRVARRTVAIPQSLEAKDLKAELTVITQFGHLPDIGRWKIGDLLFFSSIGTPDPDDKKLQDYQAKLFGAEHAHWHHVAVYTGAYQLCHADYPDGVRLGTIFPYVGNYRIKVRRVRQVQRLRYKGATGSRIAVAALNKIGTPYSEGRWREAELMAKMGMPVPATDPNREPSYKTMMCTDLYVHAFSAVCAQRLVKNERVVCPAELSAEMTQLEDVTRLKWIRMEAAPGPSSQP